MVFDIKKKRNFKVDKIKQECKLIFKTGVPDLYLYVMQYTRKFY